MEDWSTRTARKGGRTYSTNCSRAVHVLYNFTRGGLGHVSDRIGKVFLVS